MYKMFAGANALIGAVIGFILGYIAPKAACRMAEYKCRLRGKEWHENNSRMRKAVCCLVSAAYLALIWSCTALLDMLSEPETFTQVELVFHGALLSTFTFIAFTISLVDIDTHLIPNELVAILLGTGLVYRVLFCGGTQAIWSSLLAAVAALVFMIITLALYYALKKRMGMGAGDVKYILVIAVILGWDNMAYFLIGTSAAILLYVFAVLKFGILRLSDYFPYAAHLSVGFLGALAYATASHMADAFKLAAYAPFVGN